MAGKVEKLGHNKYRIRWTGKDGVRHCRTIHGTRAAAAKVKAEIEMGLSGVVLSKTFDGYWEETVKPSLDDLSVNTRSEYIRLWEKNISPAIGCMELDDLDWKGVQAFINGISAPTVQRHAFAVLRKVCNMAIRDGYIRSNPCDRSIRFRQHAKGKRCLLKPMTLRRFCARFEG